MLHRRTHLISMLGAVSLGFLSSSAFAEERDFVGVWDGYSGVPIYTKLVFADDGGLTYCNVQSCRNVSCFDMAYEGDIDGRFSYADELRSWAFEWVDDTTIKGEFRNAEGEVAFAWYEPEYPMLPPEVTN